MKKGYYILESDYEVDVDDLDMDEINTCSSISIDVRIPISEHIYYEMKEWFNDDEYNYEFDQLLSHGELYHIAMHMTAKEKENILKLAELIK